MSSSHQRNCPTSIARNIVCIDEYGRQHLKQILFCNCESDVATLVKMQLWPSSAKRPVMAFHYKLMELLEALVMECQVSLQKFCDMLGIINKSPMLPKWVKNVYSCLNSDSFDEFRYHQYMRRNGKLYVNKDMEMDELCPLCPKGHTGSVVESMDGCFGLVRKKSAGANFIPSRHGLTMFADQNDVDNFVDNYTESAKQATVNCNEFKSGEVTDMLRSKGKNKLYDEKGVFGRVCRHGFPKGFLSIKHGERIAYSVYEVERLLSKHNGTAVNIKVTYDIACTLEAHLKKNERKDILNAVSFAIPIFHCYGHKSACQIKFSPRRQRGYALTDGEGIERLWSYLRGFSSMTKEMSAGRRTDMLTDALLHYSTRQLLACGEQLLTKLKRCPILIENTVLQLTEIFSGLSVPYDEVVVSSWMRDEENLILARDKKTVVLTWEQKYVQNLIHLHQLRLNVASIEEGDHNQLVEVVKKTKDVTKIVRNIEKSNKVSKRWKPGEKHFNASALCLEEQRRSTVVDQTYNLAVERLFLISLKRKYSDGQAIASKLSKQITRKTNAIKSVITKYNASLTALQDCVDGLPDELKFDIAKDPESSLYSNFSTQRPVETVPFSVKRSAIDLQNFLERCKEEQELLLEEVENLFMYYIEKRDNFTEILERRCLEESRLSNGICNHIRKEICEINNVLVSLRLTLSDYIKPWLAEKLDSVDSTSSFHMSNVLETCVEEESEMECIDKDAIEDLVDLLDDRDEDEE
ncbi:uncharacterized protein LOC114540363 [Dendronephthya gigantea]|uniref:uncharacterized protein LOC114540363 n=1 Tax=Dendronephthya gigantea TaxID=151771 RepID=UPI00106DAD10|nr:uncharacterized protein LOC114540363 [Dendronephthya gigantea]